MARGADFKKGNPVVRLKKLRTVILPLFQNAILRAGHLGDAMDSRCYTRRGRICVHAGDGYCVGGVDCEVLKRRIDK